MEDTGECKDLSTILVHPYQQTTTTNSTSAANAARFTDECKKNEVWVIFWFLLRICCSLNIFVWTNFSESWGLEKIFILEAIFSI